MSEVGFEPTPPFGDQNTQPLHRSEELFVLESGALDHSAILTACHDLLQRLIICFCDFWRKAKLFSLVFSCSKHCKSLNLDVLCNAVNKIITINLKLRKIDSSLKYCIKKMSSKLLYRIFFRFEAIF